MKWRAIRDDTLDGGVSMRIIRTATLVGILSLLIVSQTGCFLLALGAVGGASAGGVMYVKGKSVDSVDGNPKQVAVATEKAFKDLDLVLVSSNSTNIDAEIVGRTADDTKVNVVATADSGKISTVKVRVGVFGDDPLQQRVLDKIKANLAASAATQPSSSTITAAAK